MNANTDLTLPPPAPSGQQATIRLPIATLAPDPRNPRRISDEAAAGLSVSTETFGDLSGIIFNDRTKQLIAGHQRVKVLRAAGATEFHRDGNAGWIAHPKTGERFPVRFVDQDETWQRLANLTANNSFLQGTWTEDAIEQVRGLEHEAQFAELELDKLLAEIEAQQEDAEPTDGNCDPDDVPDVPAEPISKLGDLWLLGEHRLLCGSSTNTADVVRLMNGEKATLMSTDPPYLVDYTGTNHPQSFKREQAGKSNNKGWDAYKDPETSVAFFSDFIRVARENALVVNPACYQWHASRRQKLVEEAWTENGLLWHQQIIWVKSRPILTRSHFMWQHEPAAYGWPEGRPPALRPPVSGECSTVWNIAQNTDEQHDGCDDKVEHPTQKPVAIFERPISYHTRPGDVVYEPFSGSGSQIIAAERLGRRCFAMELAPEFVDVAAQRWAKFTGKDPVLESTGRTLSELNGSRQCP
ncbi:MAG: DNA modification methylase [Polyangia bacterium]|jgi:DNA modification methylase